MRKSNLLKGFTLLSFVFFISTFLMYRIGIFDNYFSYPKSEMQSSPNGGTITTSQQNTTKFKKDSSHKLLLSSSKVLILTDKKYSIFDSLKPRQKPRYIQPKTAEIMSSSKSAIIFKPLNFKDHGDTIYLDSTRMKKK